MRYLRLIPLILLISGCAAFPGGGERAEELQGSFRRAAARVRPAVVEIEVAEIAEQESPGEESWPWEFFFDNEAEPELREFRTEGLGSGVIIRVDGERAYVLTNNHVVAGADEIKIILGGRQAYRAEKVGGDSRKDLALLSFAVPEGGVPVASLGDSDALQVGDWVLAVGNPLGYASTVTVGIVSALRRPGPRGNINDFIQTDAAINQGNSGGALINLDGQVVGINTWIAAPGGVGVGLGFAIPVNNVKKAVDDFIRFGEVRYAWLGVSVSAGGREGGLRITNIYLGSPADRAGLLPGDILEALDGTPLRSPGDFIRMVGDAESGAPLEIRIRREGRVQVVTAVPGGRPAAAQIADNYRRLWPGFILGPADDGGVAVAAMNRSAAREAGLRTGDRIIAVNGEKIDNMMNFYRVLNDKEKRKYQFQVMRDGESLLLTVVPEGDWTHE